MKKVVSKSSVSGMVRPPCSKSYAQRAMAAALLCEGESVLSNIGFCDDTRHALVAIRDLGAEINYGRDVSEADCLGAENSFVYSDNHTLYITGGLNPAADTINIGESGLAARMFTPIAALTSRPITITGEGTVMGRPMGMMTKPLTDLGVSVESEGGLPLTVHGPMRGGVVEVDGSVSSQFTTGLLMALPLTQEDSIIRVERPYSLPYLSMTVELARRFGIRIEHNDHSEYYIAGGQHYLPTKIEIEGDWSSAAFILTAGAIAGEVTARNMNPLSLQADRQIIEALSRAGARIVETHEAITVSRGDLAGFEFDATHSPDLFPILVVLAANCEGRSVIKGASRLVYKESDRARAILEEFGKLGMNISIRDNNYMVIEGLAEKGSGVLTEGLAGGTIDSRGDHRIAMAAAVAGLASSSPVTIMNAEAVSKSYPRFWEDLHLITNYEF